MLAYRLVFSTERYSDMFDLSMNPRARRDFDLAGFEIFGAKNGFYGSRAKRVCSSYQSRDIYAQG